MDPRPEKRGQAYCYAKARQDELVAEYAKQYGIPCVFVRPGVVYGPGNEAIHARVGLGTFGLFLHLGGSNKVPLTYVDNCAEAIVPPVSSRASTGKCSTLSMMNCHAGSFSVNTRAK
jgi:nucleoside-diphosphate-sugar epimerase